MSAPEQFPYPPLPPSVDAIRVLTLEPGAFTDRLKCTLATAPFSAKPRYAALSYTWGPPYPDMEGLAGATAKNSSSYPSGPSVDITTVTVNNHTFKIHTNLALALLHLRSKTITLPLWIDAICINQSDILERNAQVSMMSFIYSRAQKVIAWLGIREINPSVADPLRILSREWEDGTVGDLASSVVEGRKIKSSREPSRNSFDFPRIAMSGYWTRLWIVQEACLARELVFVFGAKMWRFEEVERWEMLEHARKLAREMGREVTGNERVEARAMLRIVEARVGRHTEAMRFEHLVERFMGQRCGEARDRLFALLGLATDVCASGGDDDGALENYLRSLDNEGGHGELELSRGTGMLLVDYSRRCYDIWADAVKAVFFRARPLSRRFGKLDVSPFERSISVVRTSCVIQAALGSHNIERELGSLASIEMRERPIIQAMGYFAGEITQLGPGYTSLVGSFRSHQDWLNICESTYSHTDPHDLGRIRAMNETYLAKTINYGDAELERITEIRSPAVIAWQGENASFDPTCADFEQKYTELWDDVDSQRREGNPSNTSKGPRICIGTQRLIALVPPAAMVGDVIVRFWNCDSALIMREVTVDGRSSPDVPYFLLVGRADVAEKDEVDSGPSDTGRSRIMGAEEHNRPIWVLLGLGALQRLTASSTIYTS
ncbi:hypothetical protein OQA88_12655 [Cercophora sp. LCS_1]